MHFPDPQSFKKAGKGAQKGKVKVSPYQSIIDWFGTGNDLMLLQDDSDTDYRNNLYQVDGLYSAMKQFYPNTDYEQEGLLMEFILHGLSEFSLISKKGIEHGGYNFTDMLGSMLNMNMGELDEDDF